MPSALTQIVRGSFNEPCSGRRGEKVRERHLTFPDLAAMLSALSPKRLELLRAVHETPAPSL